MANEHYNDFVEAYNRFDSRPLKGQSMKDFYVDDFTKDITNSIIKTIEITDKYRKILVIGHTGCGKSTILNKVAEELKKRYHVAAFSVADTLNLMDMETIDVLMTIYLQLLYSLKEVQEGIDPFLRASGELIKEIRKKLKLDGEVGFNLLESISFKIKVESEARETIREEFRKQVETIQQNISNVYDEIRKKTKKDILIIIDDLDKLQDEASTKKIFFKEAHMFIMLKAKIIFTFPLATYYSPEFVHITDKFSHEFIRLLNLYNIEKNYQESSLAVLKKLVLKRIEQKFISPEALKYLIDHSGGLLRDLIKFIQDACKIAIDRDLPVIDEKTSQKVVCDKINEYDRLFDFTKYENKVKKIIETQNRYAVENEILVYLLRYLFVLQYGRQGEQTWYDAHPCLKDRLKRYDEEGIGIPDEWLEDQ